MLSYLWSILVYKIPEFWTKSYHRFVRQYLVCRIPEFWTKSYHRFVRQYLVCRIPEFWPKVIDYLNNRRNFCRAKNLIFSTQFMGWRYFKFCLVFGFFWLQILFCLCFLLVLWINALDMFTINFCCIKTKFGHKC